MESGTPYPNPTSQNINFTFTPSQTNEINIFDMTGKNVFSKRVEKILNMDIDVHNWEKGVYIYEIISDNHTKTTDKFIKQ